MPAVSISGASQFSDPIVLKNGGAFDVSILNNSSFVGTVTLQRKRIDEADSAYRDIKTYTDVVEETGQVAGAWHVRIGCKTGDYTSGGIDAEVEE